MKKKTSAKIHYMCLGVKGFKLGLVEETQGVQILCGYLPVLGAGNPSYTTA